jgi:hypothetical protein
VLSGERAGLQAGRKDRRTCEVLFLKLAAFTNLINPDPYGPGATGIQRLLGRAGGCGPSFAGVDLPASIAIADGGSIFGSPRAELVDVPSGLAGGLQPCQGAFGLDEDAAAARRRISSKRVSRLLKREMATTSHLSNAASRPLLEICGGRAALGGRQHDRLA